MKFKSFNFKSFNKVLIGSVLSLSCLVNSANAGLITIGALTSNDDDSTSVISDTLNNLDWLRWDELADLTYAETLFQTSVVGDYSDWTIAGANEANLFLDALFNSRHDCATNTTELVTCGDSGNFTSAQYTRLLGDSSTRGASSVDAAWFYDDVITDAKAGFLNLKSGTSNEKFNTFGATIADTDSYSTLGPSSAESIGWLMFRTSTAPASVPEPSTLAVFAIGLMGLVARRFKRQS